jgi:hypothetical protein
MGHADLIHKLESLPPAQRLAVENLVEALAASRDVKDAQSLAAALATARGSWPRRMTLEEIDAEVAQMRSEWDGRS